MPTDSFDLSMRPDLKTLSFVNGVQPSTSGDVVKTPKVFSYDVNGGWDVGMYVYLSHAGT